MMPVDYAARFPKLDAWIRGKALPTLKQLEAFASATYTPIGQLFLQQPPDEPIPIPDMRTMGTGRFGRPSPNLLDTIYLCQRRQDWYREFARSSGERRLPFVGSVGVSADVKETAEEMRRALGFDLAERKAMGDWNVALRSFVGKAEELGVLVMISGIVGVNTHRQLDPEEFRGFALVDDLAPVVFVNGADAKAAQMFTLAHELAHIWAGEPALSDSCAEIMPGQEIEQWCNHVAAELLVPLVELTREFDEDAPVGEEIQRLRRVFKVSSLVIIRRLHDAGVLGRDEMWTIYREELSRLRQLSHQSSDGGNFYFAQGARVSRRFARAVFTSTWEGRSSFSEAFRLLNVKKMETFRNLGDVVGMGS
jgi:Zn-dependent peptidase ImmA (M78 family)